MIIVRPLIDAAALAAWARTEGFRELKPSAWHVTIMNTPGRLNPDDIVPEGGVVVIQAGHRDVVRFGPFITLTFETEALAARHRAFLAAGAEYDHHAYRPHVTFSVDGPRDLSGVTPYAGELRLGPELWE